MKFEDYINLFQKVAIQIEEKGITEKKLKITVGEVLNSIFLKLYKISWTNSTENPLTAETRIFFSIWVTETTLQEKKIYYNIHALKLRKLNGYNLESRKFADSFREKFKNYSHKWENVKTDFGPLTLMEGWVKLENEKVQEQILQIVNNFLEIENLIDKTLIEFKK